MSFCTEKRQKFSIVCPLFLCRRNDDEFNSSNMFLIEHLFGMVFNNKFYTCINN